MPRKKPPLAANGKSGPYTYQNEGRYFAMIAEGLEDLAGAELTRLGARKVEPGYRGLYFQADRQTLYRVTYRTRLIQKIIAPLEFLDCHSTKYLYRRAQAIDWSDFLSVDQSFAIVANVSNSHIRHSRYAAQCLKDAIVDQFRERCDRRPNVDTEQPDVWLNLYIHNNRAVLGLEVSGGSLHKRGYRQIGHEAPMQETLAAGLLDHAGWKGEQPLCDPMCGSGTILCEALMMYCRIPAGYFRKRFGFEALPDFDAALWQDVREKNNRNIRPLPEGLIAGSDIDPSALEAAAANLGHLPHGGAVQLKHIDFRNIKALHNTCIVSNPPYGLRLQKREGMQAFCKDLGDWLKQRCRDSTAYLYFGDREHLKQIGLRSTWKKPLRSGGLDGRLVKLDIYEASAGPRNQ
jgi:putative N6-adenine-specific DNA methylase